jgi:hypothetical protein
MQSTAVKSKVRTFPDGLQRVPKRLSDGGHLVATVYDPPE